MPIYMDRHDVAEEVTAKIVAEIHLEDLRIQHKYCCKGLTYWYDDQRKTAFCLVEAPNKEAITEMHSEAHGEVPNTIIEVDASIVESFLGRIEDPSKSQKKELNIINNPAFRILTIIKFVVHGIAISPSNKLFEKIKVIIADYEGRLINNDDKYLLISNTSTTKAINASLAIKKAFAVSKEDTKQLNIGVSAGVPVTKEHGFFEETIKTAMRLSNISRGQIVITSEVKELYESENQNLQLSDKEIKTLPFQEEQFLNSVMNYLDSEWQNPDLGVEKFCSHLGLSTSQLYRKTKSILHTSTNNLIQEHRLENSIKLLYKKEKSISEIAYETGFNSAAYFTKCFHKMYGISPSSFIKNT
ncbi:transcriptional regulator, AraC family [Maribacter orientalis]|uniref:Transcriptional regulator, AraC family n=1 Tax=Maribacter orientalis TaxID=228957 RepID=A0A1H7I153_9FLAO|nr:nickel-binding protein [Maribacter orientalis]SEK56261.1 transcriptional regulator, AraC family [Maribacter orientalis]